MTHTVLTLVSQGHSQGDHCLYAARSPPICKLLGWVWVGVWVGGCVEGWGFGVWVGLEQKLVSPTRGVWVVLRWAGWVGWVGTETHPDPDPTRDAFLFLGILLYRKKKR